MGESVLVVASWGDPSSWKPVYYVLSDIRVKSRTSLQAIAQKYPGAGVLVVVQETLLAPRNTSALKTMLEEASNSSEPPLLSHARDDSDYSRLISMLGEVITDLAQAWISGNVDAVVAPGVGDYPFEDLNGEKWRGVWKLSEGTGTPFDYYASTVLLHIIRKMPFAANPLRLVVDLTHGVNYTATALYRAALIAARNYSAATHSKVIVEVYNSEPWAPGVEELRIWNIREEHVNPRAAASHLVYTMLANRLRGGEIMAPLDKTLLPSINYKEVKTEAVNTFNEQRRKVAELISTAAMSGASIIGGFPLLFLQAGLEALTKNSNWGLLVEIAEKLLSTIPSTKLTRSNNRITVTHIIGLSLPAIKSMHAGLALTSHASQAYSKIRGDSETLQENCQGHQRVAATTKALQKTLEMFLSTPLITISKQEISKLEEHEKKPPQSHESEDLYIRISLATSKKTDHPVKPQNANQQIDERIFSAHAGLNNNIIDVLYRNDKIMIAYNCNILPKLQDVSKNILNKLKNTVFAQPDKTNFPLS